MEVVRSGRELSAEARGRLDSGGEPGSSRVAATWRPVKAARGGPGLIRPGWIFFSEKLTDGICLFRVSSGPALSLSHAITLWASFTYTIYLLFSFFIT